jgi:hypothetical protein
VSDSSGGPFFRAPSGAGQASRPGLSCLAGKRTPKRGGENLAVPQGKKAEAANDPFFRQHRQLMDTNPGANVQAGGLPLTDFEIEGLRSGLGGNGRSDKIAVAGVEQNDPGPHFSPGSLVKLNPDQDDFTERELNQPRVSSS